MLELYTFFTMGGNMSDIELVVLDTEEWSRMRVYSKEEKIVEAFAHFDAARTQCFDPNDKARLLSIVEAGGGIPRLNELIRQLANVDALKSPSWSARTINEPTPARSSFSVRMSPSFSSRMFASPSGRLDDEPAQARSFRFSFSSPESPEA